MKMNRKLFLLISFCLGATIFAVSVFAEITSKTGYDQLKDAFKNTGEILSNEVESFTMNLEYMLKSNDKTIYTTSEISKYDLINQRSIEERTTEYVNVDKYKSYYYSDAKKHISQRNGDVYIVNEYMVEREYHRLFHNPFEGIEDVERIFDAFIGGLGNHVMVEENADGSKYFSGAVSDSQIPTLINAVMSYGFKRIIIEEVTYNDLPIPIIEDDIYVKKVSGRAFTNSDGIMESLFSSFVFSGKDKAGNTYDFTIEIVMKIFDINSTEVIEPDLTDKNIEVRIEGASQINDKHLGKWKSEVVIEKDGQLQKIGEKIVEITSINSENIYGKYYSIYNEEYLEHSKEFEFIAEIEQYRGGGIFKDIDSLENKGTIYIDRARMYFNIDRDYRIGEPESLNYNNYQKVFED
ncbi:UNVERIFIED_CONTAM: hypothetical protein Cloal_1331 [Acetivibrio alkalicellulosi]